METNGEFKEPWKLLSEIAELGDHARLREEAERMGSRECARAISRLNAEEQSQVLQALTPEAVADLMEEISEEQARALIFRLPPGVAARVFDAMRSNTAADLLGGLDFAEIEGLLGRMAPEAAANARILVSYKTDVAGGLMVREFLAYPVTFTTQQVIDDMRLNARKYSEYSIQYSFVTQPDGTLTGVLPLRDLLLAPGDKPITEIMIQRPLSVLDEAPLEELEKFFEEHAYLGVPVVDAKERLIGVVRRTDVQEALGKRANRDYLRSQGIVGGEELRSMPVLTRSARRLSWLSVNIGLNVLAASVIAFYQDTLESVIALAVFLPIISDMSGCSGNQAVAVSMRELALGLVKPIDFLHVWFKEASVGIINGLALGVLLGSVAWLWKGNPYLGLVAGGALALNTLLAVCIGGLLPLLVKRLKFDPALASGPILTTITDMCGFFFVLSFATVALGRLT
ncbi:MAG TPA: magnesium transporter [Candidatus Hydrogenedentes bacterium]|nr:magnesium transporter [Candidatus Hydrogenedentota bacterium]